MLPKMDGNLLLLIFRYIDVIIRNKDKFLKRKKEEKNKIG